MPVNGQDARVNCLALTRFIHDVWRPLFPYRSSAVSLTSVTVLPPPQVGQQPKMGSMLHQLKSSLAQYAESDEVAMILMQMLQVGPLRSAPSASHVAIFYPINCLLCLFLATVFLFLSTSFC
jgi:hypothetical protein